MSYIWARWWSVSSRFRGACPSIQSVRIWLTLLVMSDDLSFTCQKFRIVSHTVSVSKEDLATQLFQVGSRLLCLFVLGLRLARLMFLSWLHLLIVSLRLPLWLSLGISLGLSLLFSLLLLPYMLGVLSWLWLVSVGMITWIMSRRILFRGSLRSFSTFEPELMLCGRIWRFHRLGLSQLRILILDLLLMCLLRLPTLLFIVEIVLERLPVVSPHLLLLILRLIRDFVKFLDHHVFVVVIDVFGSMSVPVELLFFRVVDHLKIWIVLVWVCHVLVFRVVLEVLGRSSFEFILLFWFFHIFTHIFTKDLLLSGSCSVFESFSVSKGIEGMICWRHSWANTGDHDHSRFLSATYEWVSQYLGELVLTVWNMRWFRIHSPDALFQS